LYAKNEAHIPYKTPCFNSTSIPQAATFLQIPGPSPVPDRILRAMSLPTIDHRGPEFGALGKKVLADIQKIFQTQHPVIIYPASGTGAWEAALTNVLSPGDQVLMYETGHFAAVAQNGHAPGRADRISGPAGHRAWRAGELAPRACRPT
jgi:alanine-glyoxylate transaminase/serine-glyoxylate transaminase/serine-pyruvate transaminase